jgi:enediyne biosynthesis protein E4
MVVVSLLYGCGSGSGDAGSSNGNGGSASEVPRVPAPGAGRQVFTELAIQSGLVRTFGFMDPAGTVAEKMGSGLAAVDYDNDGDIDLYVVSGDVEPNRLFQNQGDGSFIDVAASVGLDLLHKGSGPTFADIDNDGDLDLFVGALNGDRYYLMENRDGMFVDITAQSGISLQALNTFSATFCDYDLDQDLDLFLSHWGNTERQDTETVWRNNGDGTFESDSIGSGIARSLLKPTGSPVLLAAT